VNERYITAHTQYVAPWCTERVLVDSQDTSVQQQSLRGVVDRSQIDRHEQLRSEHRPQTHLHALLVPTQTIVADDQLQYTSVYVTSVSMSIEHF